MVKSYLYKRLKRQTAIVVQVCIALLMCASLILSSALPQALIGVAPEPLVPAAEFVNALLPGPSVALAATGEVTGRVFDDVNANGVDDGEPGRGAVIVTAYDATGAVVASAFSASTGEYTLSGLTDGESYRIEFLTPSGYVSSPVGADSETAVTFVQSPEDGVDYGVRRPETCSQLPAEALVGQFQMVATCGVLDENEFIIGMERTDTLNYAPGTQTPLMFMNPNWTLKTLGNIYFTEFDALGYIYAPASQFTLGSLFGPGLRQYGTLGGATASSTIYRLDNVTGDPIVWSVLPAGTNANGTDGLGGITYYDAPNMMYVVNMGDATIYRLDRDSGAILSTFRPDPATLGVANGFQAVPFGLDIYDGRLYYTVHDATGSDRNQRGALVVRSVELSATGEFLPTTDREDINQPMPYLGTEAEPVVADIDFSEDGRMAVSSFSAPTIQLHESYYDSGRGSLYNHGAGAYVFDQAVGGTWTQSIFTSVGQESYGPQAINSTATGGVAWNLDQATDRDILWLSGGDFTGEDGNWGVIGYDVSQLDNTVSQEDATSYIQYLFPNQSFDTDPKGSGGDVDVFRPYSTTSGTFYNCQEIGNYVWVDSDKDGIQDPDEAPIGGVEVVLRDAGGNILATTTTNGEGEYYFNYDNVPGGLQPNTDYKISIDTTQSVLTLYALTQRNAGANDAIDSDGVMQGTLAAIDLETGDAAVNNHTYDFGFTLGSIGDTIWSDPDDDGNAVIDGDDFPIAGVVVNLLDSSGAVIATETTDGNGNYLFEGLPLNQTYTVQVDTTTLPDVKQTNPAFDPEGDDDNISTVTLTSANPDDRDRDFAYFQTLGSIGDTIWSDVDDDGNGVIDGDDFPIAGVVVNLLDDTGAVIATDMTDANGEYLFEQLPLSKTYTVQVDTTTLPDVKQGNPAYDPEGNDDNLSTVTLTVANPDDRDRDFAYFQTLGSIGDTIWSDIDDDGNGLVDGDDLPLEGVVVQLLDDTGAVIATETTDANGEYLFDQLPLNKTYTVVVDTTTLPDDKQANPAFDPEGDDDSTSAVTLTVADPDDRDRDFAYFPTLGSIGDTVWSDEDNDGNDTLDGDDVPLEGVVVRLLDDTGAVIATDTTDANGQYLFTDLRLNEIYTVQIDTTTLPDDKQANPAYDPDGGDDSQSTVSLTVSNPDDRDQDFAYYPTLGSIGDTVWSDVDDDGNALIDGEDFPIEGVVVNLLNSSGAVIATQTTNGGGQYLFTNLPLNETYTVQIDTTTLPDVKQSNPAYDPEGNDDNQSTVTLTVANPDDRERDFAYFQTLGSIGDTIWSDPDNDGNALLDGDDFPIEGVVVNLLDDTGATIATATTNQVGQYRFDQLPLNATYTVQIDTSTLPDVKQTNPAYDSDGGDDNQSTVTLTVANPDDSTQDFAYFQTMGSIGDTVWSDVDNDGNGTVDGDDFPIAGVVVNLLDSSGAVIATDTTDANGQYLFENLPLNETYTVQIDTNTLPDVKQVNPAYDPDGGDDNQSTVTLTVDDPATPQDEANDRLQDFAYFQTLGSIGDQVWHDDDADGNDVIDGDDAPIEGVVVNLLDSSGAVIATDTTDANGNYLFDQLPLNETYTVQIDTSTLPDVKQDNPTYDPDGGDDNQSTVTLTVDDPATPTDEANDRRQDFAYFQTLGSIGDTVWSDVDDDGNGVVDGDDFPIADVVVNLLDSSGAVIATDTTDASGQYLFDQLPLNETYTVQVDTTTLPDVKQTNPAYDPDGGDDNQSTVTLTVDDPATPADEANDRMQDFAYFQTLGSIGDTIWSDVDDDGNAVVDGEDFPIAGVTVKLLDASGAVIATDVTDAAGQYLFEQLLLNETYTVQVDTTTLPDVKQTNPAYDPDGGDDNQSTVTLTVDDPATPADEANDRMQDFAYFQTLGSIGDTIWSDVDDDGNAVVDGEDFPIAGVTVKLLDASGAVIATDVTDAAGQYLFEQLLLNETYTVQVDTTTLPDVKQTNPAYDPDGGDDNQSTVTLTVDDPATPADEANDRMQDFAYFQTLGSIGDTIWSDVDDDGNAVVDGEDFPIAGVTVKLLDASGAVIATDVTDAAGQYLFEQLLLNETYTVQVDTTTLPDVKQTNPAYDPDGGDDNQSTVTLTVDDPATPADEANDRMQDFAYFQTLGSIGDTIWSDVDDDGNAVVDGEDFPIAGVTVKLLDASGAVIATDVTDAAGQYLFEQLLLNETYTVQVDTTTLPDVKQTNPAYDPDGGDDNQSTVTLTVDDPATPADEANDRMQDFAYFQTLGSIGDTIWSDVDDDGNAVVDGEDFPIEGVVVKLLDASGGVIATDTTDENGQYLFDQLLLNETYTVQVDTTTLPDVKQGNPAYDPDGGDDNQSTVTLTVDDPATPADEANDRMQDFAYFQTLGSIGDTIWSDVDDDGNAVVDGDDFPIEGVTVKLLDSSGAVIATETTDENGAYLFDQLPLNATYTVQVDTTTLPNVKQGNPAYDPEGNDDNQSTVTLTVDAPDDRNRDFAYFQTLGTIGDTIWSDIDADGNALIDGEDFPIEGVVVKLLDSSGALIATETTDENGEYLFTQLLLNEPYTVQVDTTTLPDVKQGNPAYDPDGGNDNQSSVMLTVDMPNDRNQDFAYFQTLGAIGDTIWSDPDGDGNEMMDGDDFPIEGVVVKLLDSSGAVIETESTDENGEYLFTQLPLNATYTVQIDTTTLPDVKQGNPAYDPDGGGDNQSTVTLTLDEQVNTDQDFAYFQTLGSIGDTIWHDNDNDGNAVIDGDDFPLEGVVVKLLDANGGVITTDTTDANGRYLFDQLPLNETYTVQIDTTTLPDVKLGNPAYDPDGADDNQSTVTLTVDNPDNTEQDFAYFQTLGSIGDTIWSDPDGDANGMMDGDDFPIEGVVVRLIDASGAVIATDATDASGKYMFDQLPLNETYTVQVDTPTLPDIKQVNPAYDADGGADNQSTITLTPENPDNTEQDFAYFQTLGSIGDQIWHDDDNDGNDMVDGDDEPLANVTVNLLDSSGAVITTDVTDASGMYLFEQLPLNETYTVQIDTSTLPVSKQGNPAYDPDGGDDSQSTVTLTLDAPDNGEQDFAYFIPPVPLGSIGDTIWSDDDNDGNNIVDGDDDPLTGVTVNLLDSSGAVIATDITDGNGNYLFTGLPLDATYTVQIDTDTLPVSKQENPAYDPDGGADSQATVTLTTDNPDNADQDFAYFIPPVPLGSIGDMIWSDDDQDGNELVDGDDVVLEGVKVELLDANGTIIATDVTDADGTYLFTGLPLDASYTVMIDPMTLPESKQGNPAYDPDGGNDNQSTVLLTSSNPDALEQDFAYFIPAAPLGSIGDQIWHDDDQDGNGTLDGDDEPIEGVVVNLLDSGGSVIATTTTDENGRYLFADLPVDATYTVQIDPLTLPVAKQGNSTYDPDGGADSQATITLTAANPDVRDQDFAYFAPPEPTGTIGDQIWHDDDRDGNGVLDGDDSPIEGVVVNLLDGDGNVIATDTTDANGFYRFEEVPMGTYIVQVDTSTLPEAKQGNPAYDPDGGDDSQSTVTLTPEALENLDQDFAYFAPAAPTAGPAIELQKTVYAGHDGGAGCPGGEIESGANSPITYCFEVVNIGDTYLNDIQVNDVDIAITRDNMMLLSGTEPLAPGASMRFYYETTLEREMVNTANTSGNPTDASGTDIAGLEDPTDSDIAQVKVAASLGDTVWLDRNANGVQDADERGLENVVVYLLDAESNVLDTTTTDANGFYLFDDIAPGDYAIRVELPAVGYQFTLSDQLDDAFDSDVNQETGLSPLTTLDPSESDRTWDAGILALPSLNVEKKSTTDVVQPGAVLIYTISYSNTGVGDSTGVKLTEVVPRDTSYVADGSTEGWVCERGAVEAGTICSFDIGALPAGSSSTEDVIFVVRVANSIDAETKLIDNQVLINDDGLAGPSASGQTVDNATVEINRPTSLDVDFEPGSGGGNERVFLPLVSRNQFKANGEPIELTIDQVFMIWICSFMDNFGWTSDACYIDLE